MSSDLLYNHQMPKPTLRKDGRWIVWAPQKNGTRRPCYGRTAEDALKAYNRAIGAGELRLRPGSISEFFVTDYAPYMKEVRRVQVESLARYDSAWIKSVCPAIGNMLFSELTPRNREAKFIEALGKGSPSSKGLAKTVLIGILKRAAMSGRCSFELVSAASCLYIPSSKPKYREDIAEAAAKVLEAAKELNHWIEGYIWVAMTVGLRKGELCGIKRGDIDPQKGTLTLNRQRRRTGEKDRLKGRGDGEVRKIGLDRETLETMLGYFRPGAIYLVTDENGKPPAPNHLDRAFAPVCERAGVHVTPHDLRAAAICRLIAAEATDKEIMEIVGHLNRDMVDWYAGVSTSRSRKGLSRLASSDNS